MPELIFGNLLTSSNYNDNEKKVRVCPPTCLPACLLFLFCWATVS